MARCMTLLLVGLLLLSCALTGSDGTDLGMTAQDMSLGPVDMSSSGPPTACLSSAWRWENPLPTGHSLNGVWGADANNVWAVGQCGSIV